MSLSVGGYDRCGATESWGHGWGPLLWPTKIRALVVWDSDYNGSWQMFNLSLTWLIGLFVMVNLCDLPNFEFA